MEFEIDEFEVNGQGAELPVVLSMGDTLQLKVRIRSRDGRAPVAHFGIVRADGTPVYGVNTEMDEVPVQQEEDGTFFANIEFAAISLLPGSYNLRAHALDTEGIRLFDSEERALSIRGETREFGMVKLPHRWLDAGGESIVR